MKSRREGCFMTLLFSDMAFRMVLHSQFRATRICSWFCMIRRSMGAQEGNTRCKGHQVDTMKTPKFSVILEVPVGDEYLHSD
jgi:hypothetical protein